MSSWILRAGLGIQLDRLRAAIQAHEASVSWGALLFKAGFRLPASCCGLSGEGWL